jgi:DNA-binding GntR family transcriptional regulator
MSKIVPGKCCDPVARRNAVTAQRIGQLPRTTLRTETQQALRARIVDGRLAAGSNVVERDLSQALGVSRTPLREALLGLEGEGLLRAEPQRGFFVAGFSVEEARELYPLIGTLEALAIERGRAQSISHLKEINRKFRTAKDAAAAVAHDREWHETLIHQCALPRSVAILEVLRTAAARYEYRFFAGRSAIRESARQHDRIARALQRKRFKSAASLLKRNWEQGLQWVERNFQK